MSLACWSVFLLDCLDIQSFNFTLEFANADKMPTYTALRGSIIAPFYTVVDIQVVYQLDQLSLDRLSNRFRLLYSTTINCWTIAMAGQRPTPCNRLILRLNTIRKPSIDSWCTNLIIFTPLIKVYARIGKRAAVLLAIQAKSHWRYNSEIQQIVLRKSYFEIDWFFSNWVRMGEPFLLKLNIPVWYNIKDI